MHRPDIQRLSDSPRSHGFIGYAHLGVELGSRDAVDTLTWRLQSDGSRLVLILVLAALLVVVAARVLSVW